MKRIFMVVMLMLVFAACGSTHLSSTSTSTFPPSTYPATTYPSTTYPSTTYPTSTYPPSTYPPSTTATNNPYYTVSGQVVHRDTGTPYPNAYVRFEWLVSANYGREAHTLTNAGGRYAIQLAPGQYQVTAGDSCDLNAGFSMVGRGADDVMITVPGTSEVDFVEYPLTPGADIPGVC